MKTAGVVSWNVGLLNGACVTCQAFVKIGCMETSRTPKAFVAGIPNSCLLNRELHFRVRIIDAYFVKKLKIVLCNKFFHAQVLVPRNCC